MTDSFEKGHVIDEVVVMTKALHTAAKKGELHGLSVVTVQPGKDSKIDVGFAYAGYGTSSIESLGAIGVLQRMLTDYNIALMKKKES